VAENNRELADFLRRAREKADPDRAGLPADDRVRRVAGLRREEVARIARVSTDYYTRLEQGRRITPSAGVVDAIARALDLDDAGRTYLLHLIGTAPTGTRRPQHAQRARPGLHQLLDTLDGHPAMILGRRTDVLAANRLARALLTDFDKLPANERNYARWMFLDPDARRRLIDWDEQARAVVENLRLDTARDPQDPVATALVTALSAASTDFATWWQQHGVYQRSHGTKRFRHPVVGDLTAHYETLTTPGDADQTLFIYTTEPGTRSRDAMNLLASWSLSPQPHTEDASTEHD
jgi:transcriptional regulator with XRE-family HTH domain